MRAARYHRGGEPLRVEDIPEPQLRPASAIVRVLATFVSPSAAKIFASPSAGLFPPAPFTPGMSTIGVVESIADDVRGLAVGQRVYADPLIATPNAAQPDGAFIGYFGFFAGSAALLRRWPDGGFAEKALFPAECLTPLGLAAAVDPAVLTRLGHLGTAYEALCRAEFRPGQTVIVTGATGILGICTVQVALAMGAGRVVALGRRADVLARIAALAPKRARTIEINGDANDAACIADQAGGADIVIDALGRAPGPSLTLAAIGALRPRGVAVLVGGVEGALPLPYDDLLLKEIAVRGALWFPRHAMAELLAMIGTGALDLTPIKARRFPLDRINDAVAAAAAPDRPAGFEHCAVVPS